MPCAPQVPTSRSVTFASSTELAAPVVQGAVTGRDDPDGEIGGIRLRSNGPRHDEPRNDGGMENSGHPDQRIGDADREAALRELAFHTNAGRLTQDELAQRSLAVANARTRSELEVLFADLPDGQAPIVRSPQDVALPPPPHDASVAVPAQTGRVAGPRSARGGILAASGSLALIAFLFCGLALDGWAWAWLFFLVPGALRAWLGSSGGGAGRS